MPCLVAFQANVPPPTFVGEERLRERLTVWGHARKKLTIHVSTSRPGNLGMRTAKSDGTSFWGAQISDLDSPFSCDPVLHKYGKRLSL